MAAENKIQKQSDNILKAVNIQTTITNLNSGVTQKQSTIEGKLNQLRDITAALPFTAHYQHGALATYSFLDVTSTTSTTDKLFVTVQFDVKATASNAQQNANGLLWYLVSDPSTSTKVFL